MNLITADIIFKTKREFEFTYYNDLYYFSAFGNLKKQENNKGAIGDFELFKQFLIEYRVSRNIATEKKEAAWNAFNELAQKPISIRSVDEVANKIFKDLHPRKGIPTSLSSKLLMILTPELIFPLDSLNKEALKFNKNEYQGFHEKLLVFERDNNDLIADLLIQIKERAEKVEAIFKDHFSDEIESIRKNRLLDKLLVQIGRSIGDEKKRIKQIKQNAVPLHNS